MTAMEYSNLPEAMSQSPEHEGLQVVSNNEKETISSPSITYLHPHASSEFRPATFGDAQPEIPHTKQEKHEICGLRPWLFYTIAAIAIVVVIAAAVAGGVAGSRTRSSASPQAATQSENPALTTSSPTSPSVSSTTLVSSTTSVTTSELPGPSGVTLLRDCPSSNQTIYPFGGSSDTLLFRKSCNMCAINHYGISAMIEQMAASLDECIDLCGSFDIQNETEIQSGNANACNAVCWRYDVVDPQVGLCFGYNTQNLSDGLQLGSQNTSDGAAWINQFF